MSAGGIGTRAGMANESGISTRTQMPGDYVAYAGSLYDNPNVVTNMSEGLAGSPISMDSTQPPGGRRGFDANAALKTGRMFRTRAQEQDLQRIAKAQDRLMAQRSRMDKLAMTQQGRSRAEAMERAPAEREARLEAKNQRDLQQIRASKVEPAEARLKGEEIKGKVATDKQAAELEFKREALRSKEKIAQTQIEAASKLVESQGKMPGTPQYQQAIQGEIEKMAAKAKAEGDTDTELAVLRQAQALQRQQFGGQVDIAKQMLDPAAIPAAPAPVGPQAAPAAGTTGQPAAAQPAATGGDLDGDGKVSPDESAFNQLSAILKGGINPDTSAPLTEAEKVRAKNKVAILRQRLGLNNG